MPARWLNGADLNGQRLTSLGTPTASTDAVTKAYADGLSGGGGGTVWSAAVAAGFQAMNIDPGVCGTTVSLTASTTYVYKLQTPIALSLTAATVIVGSAASGHSGFYVALYDSTGTLISGSGSADVASQFSSGAAPATSCTFGATTTVAAGLFYLALRIGTASTPPNLRAPAGPPAPVINAGLNAATTAGPTAGRWTTAANAWSGATAPSTLGTLSIVNIPAFAGVK